MTLRILKKFQEKRCEIFNKLVDQQIQYLVVNKYQIIVLFIF